MIDVKKIKKNDKCIYYTNYPLTTMSGNPEVLYFAFKEKNNGKTRYIFTKDPKITKGYRTLKAMKANNPNIAFTGLDTLEYINSDKELLEIYPYTDKLFKRFQKQACFFKNNENKYIKMLKFSKLYPNNKERFFYTPFYDKVQKHFYTYKFIFNLKMTLLCLYGLRKIIAYPIIFFIDIFRNSIQEYISYKNAQSEANYYENEQNKKEEKLYYNKTDEEWNKEKQEKKDILKDIKKNYINSNIAIFTLIIAFLSLVITQIVNTKIVKDSQKTTSLYLSENSDLKDTIVDLKKQIDILETQNKENEIILELEKIFELSTTKNINDFNSIQAKIDEIKKEIEELNKPIMPENKKAQ